MRFMGGAAVFPGGAVSGPDLDDRWEQACTTTRARAATALGLGDDHLALGLHVCALREAFEEVGFLIGTGPLEALDRSAARSGVRWLETCLEHGVRLQTDSLVPAGRWVTPMPSPVRFDARFFLAAAPPNWQSDPDPDEIDQSMWMTPTAALGAVAAGSLSMAPPTVQVLQALAGHATVHAALAAFQDRTVSPDGALVSTGLGPHVHVVVAPNPGLLTGPGTNTYVIGSEPSIVIDPAMEEEEYLAAVLAAAGPEVAAIVVTHRHPDHVGGAAELTARTGAPVRAFGDDTAGGVEVSRVHDGEVITAGPLRLTALHTPGHSSDHVCLMMGSSLFSGDNILGEGTAVIASPDGNMRAYLDSLERMKALAPERIFPGHFRPLDRGVEVIDGYIRHRREREQEILSLLRNRGRSPEEIVAAVYEDTPAALHPIALLSVRAHLEMAAAEGKVKESAGSWVLAQIRG